MVAMASREVSENDERQPLLAPSQSGSEVHLPASKSRVRGLFNKIIPKFDVISPRYRFVPLLGCLIILFNEAEYMTKQVAVFRAIEAMHCIEYYKTRDPDIAALGKHIPEKLCKADAIQKLVAQTSAWTLFGRMLCSMIGNIPLGYVADKKGRWFVLVLHKVNVVISGALQLAVYIFYPTTEIWFLYLSGIPGLIGGNFDLGLAMLFASYSDVMPSEFQRTSLFFLTTAMQYPPQAICPLLGGWLMDLDGKGTTPEVAITAGWVSGILAAVLTIFFFPETIQKSSSRTEAAQDDAPKQDEPEIGWFKRHRDTLYAKLKHSWQDTNSAVKGLGVGNLLLLGLSLLTANIGIKSIDWFGLLQYPVIKLHWRFSQATILVSIQAVITLVNYGFLLPGYNRLGVKRMGFTAATTSFCIMSFSVLLLISGSLVLGFAESVAVFLIGLLIYTLGAGLPVATQAYISVLIDKASLARVLASLAVAAVGGKVLASALFPKVLAAGLDDGREIMKGLPLFTAAILFTVAGIAFVTAAANVKVKKEPREEQTPRENTPNEEPSGL